MKVTITFEVPEKEVKSAEKYWKGLGIKMNWLTWIEKNIRSTFQAKRIGIEMERRKS